MKKKSNSNSGHKNSSYFILQLFSKHFPLESVLVKEIKETNKIAYKAKGTKNLHLFSLIQHLLSKESNLSKQHYEAVNKLLEIIRNPTKYLVDKYNQKIIIFQDDSEISFIRKCEKISAKFPPIFEPEENIYGTFNEANTFPLQNEVYEDLKGNSFPLSYSEMKWENYINVMPQAFDLKANSISTNTSFKQNYNTKNNVYKENEVKEKHFESEDYVKENEVQRKYELSKAEIELKFLKIRFDLMVKDKDACVSENKYLRAQLKNMDACVSENMCLREGLKLKKIKR